MDEREKGDRERLERSNGPQLLNSLAETFSFRKDRELTVPSGPSNLFYMFLSCSQPSTILCI